jgi:NYN domain/OST-HTH/LOTUS domain
MRQMWWSSSMERTPHPNLLGSSSHTPNGWEHYSYKSSLETGLPAACLGVSSHIASARTMSSWQVAAGKNATDIDLTVTVMHLYSCGIRKFCIVASDSDYTPLVEFLCAQGCLIMGIGNATTPSALQDACSVFIPLVTSHGSSCSQEGSTSKMMPIPLASEIILARMSQGELKVWLLEELSSYEPAPFTWVQVSQFWNHLVRSKSSFKPKAYGYKNIRGVLQASPEVFQLRPYKGRENVYEVRRVPL